MKRQVKGMTSARFRNLDAHARLAAYHLAHGGTLGLNKGGTRLVVAMHPDEAGDVQDPNVYLSASSVFRLIDAGLLTVAAVPDITELVQGAEVKIAMDIEAARDDWTRRNA